MSFGDKNYEDITQSKWCEENERGQSAGCSSQGGSFANGGQQEISKLFRKCTPWSSLPTGLGEKSGAARSNPEDRQNLFEKGHSLTSLQCSPGGQGGGVRDGALDGPDVFRRCDPWGALLSGPKGEGSAVGPKPTFASNNSEPLQTDLANVFNREQAKFDCIRTATGRSTMLVDAVRKPFIEEGTDPRPFDRISTVVSLGGVSCRSSSTVRDISSSTEIDQEKSLGFFNLNTIIKEVCKFADLFFGEQLVVIRELNPVPMLYGCSSLLRDALLSLLQCIVQENESFERSWPLVLRVSTQRFSQAVCCSIDVYNNALFQLQDTASAQTLFNQDWQVCPSELLASAREIIVSKCRGKLDLIRQQSQVTFSMSLFPAFHDSVSC